jgi:hypothetical protein
MNVSYTQTLPKALGPKAKSTLDGLFNWMVPACLRFLRKELKELCPSEDAALVVGATRIITSCLDEFQPGMCYTSLVTLLAFSLVHTLFPYIGVLLRM